MNDIIGVIFAVLVASLICLYLSRRKSKSGVVIHRSMKVTADPGYTYVPYDTYSDSSSSDCGGSDGGSCGGD
jgi:hypothetical protein